MARIRGYRSPLIWRSPSVPIGEAGDRLRDAYARSAGFVERGRLTCSSAAYNRDFAQYVNMRIVISLHSPRLEAPLWAIA